MSNPAQQTVVACALVHRILNGVPEAFVAKRAATKQFLPGVFELPGGHVEAGEDPVDGLRREFLEEFAAHISVGAPFATISYVDGHGAHAVEIIYFAKFTDPESEIQLNPEDHSEYRWVSLVDVPSLVTEFKSADDPEFKALRLGLELLGGAKLNLG